MPDNQQAIWDARYRRRRNRYPRLVAEGDSWFAYPVWSNMVDYVDSIAGRFAIARAGESGRLLAEIVRDGHWLRLVRQEHPLLILISGGGNDFVNHDFVTGGDGRGPIFRHWEPGAEAGDLIEDAKWSAKLEELHGLHDRIVGDAGGAAPVLVHGYDYIVPSDEGARYDGIEISGPWIKPTMDHLEITDPGLQLEIGRLLIDQLNDMLGELAATFPRRFIHVDLRGTLAPGDWANEIHPYQPGFRRLAVRLLGEIERVLDEDPGPVLASDVVP